MRSATLFCIYFRLEEANFTRLLRLNLKKLDANSNVNHIMSVAIKSVFARYCIALSPSCRLNHTYGLFESLNGVEKLLTSESNAVTLLYLQEARQANRRVKFIIRRKSSIEMEQEETRRRSPRKLSKRQRQKLVNFFGNSKQLKRLSTSTLKTSCEGATQLPSFVNYYFTTEKKKITCETCIHHSEAVASATSKRIRTTTTTTIKTTLLSRKSEFFA